MSRTPGRIKMWQRNHFDLLDLCSFVGCKNFGQQEFHRGKGKDEQRTWVCSKHSSKMQAMSRKDAIKLEKSGQLIWNKRKLFTELDRLSLDRRVEQYKKDMGLGQ